MNGARPKLRCCSAWSRSPYSIADWVSGTRAVRSAKCCLPLTVRKPTSVGDRARDKLAVTVRRSACGGLSAMTLALLACPALAAGSRPSRYAFANRCYAVSSALGRRFVTAAGSTGYRASARRRAAAMPFYFKPTALGVYMLQDRGGKLVSAGSGSAVVRGSTPGPPAAWAVVPAGAGSFALRAANGDGWLTVERSGAVGSASAPSSADRLRFLSRGGCRPFPEAGLGTHGTARSALYPDGTVYGYADPHLHITADYRAGGLVLSGENYDPFGIAVALGNDAAVHGPDGLHRRAGDTRGASERCTQAGSGSRSNRKLDRRALAVRCGLSRVAAVQRHPQVRAAELPRLRNRLDVTPRPCVPAHPGPTRRRTGRCGRTLELHEGLRWDCRSSGPVAETSKAGHQRR